MKADQADQLFRQQEWARAAAAYTELAEQNPYQGLYWFRKAASLLSLGKYDEAIEAYKRCQKTGYADRHVARGFGWCYALKGNPEQAAYWFERLVTLDPAWLDSLRGNPRLKKLLGEKFHAQVFGPELPADISRVEGWRADLAFMTKTLFRSHYNIHVKTPAEVWSAKIKQLHDAIPKLTDKEVALEFCKLAALAGDGHTTMWPQYNAKLGFHMLPALIYEFKDGFFIRAADPAYASIVGARVLKIGDKPIEQLFDTAEAFYGHENSLHHKWQAPSVLGTVEILKMLGAADTDDKATLQIERDGQKQSVTLTALKWDAKLHGDKDDAPTWAQMNAGAKNPLPLWLQRSDDAYWFGYLKDERLVYFHYNNIFNKQGEPFTAFVEKLFAFIEANPVEALVIDLRRNYGGSSDLYPPLIHQLIQHPKINQRGKLFTLIGRSTYSAAMNLATDLEFWTNTLFVGEPTGASPNFIGENKLFTLPYSKLRVSVSDRYHQHGASNSTDKRLWIAPNIPAELTSADYRNNIDPGLAAILHYLKERQTAR
ncbi:MAG: tetratricopeptide repeat protein [Blastocatellales bacterium]